MPKSRNPKLARFTVGLSHEIDARLELFADAAGLNKSVAASLCIAAGLNVLLPALSASGVIAPEAVQSDQVKK